MSAYIDVIGNLTKDPEVRTLQNGNSVTNINIATSTSARDRDGNKQSIFFSFSVFGKAGEACARYLSKGSKICARGEFVPNEYKTQDGQTRTAYNLNNATVEFITTNQQQQNQQPTTQYKRAETAPSYGAEDDIPF